MPQEAYIAVLGPRGDVAPVSSEKMLSGVHGITCYNSSQCEFPARCTLEYAGAPWQGRRPGIFGFNSIIGPVLQLSYHLPALVSLAKAMRPGIIS